MPPSWFRSQKWNSSAVSQIQDNRRPLVPGRPHRARTPSGGKTSQRSRNSNAQPWSGPGVSWCSIPTARIPPGSKSCHLNADNGYQEALSNDDTTYTNTYYTQTEEERLRDQSEHRSSYSQSASIHLPDYKRAGSFRCIDMSAILLHSSKEIYYWIWPVTVNTLLGYEWQWEWRWNWSEPWPWPSPSFLSATQALVCSLILFKWPDHRTI